MEPLPAEVSQSGNLEQRPAIWGPRGPSGGGNPFAYFLLPVSVCPARRTPEGASRAPSLIQRDRALFSSLSFRRSASVRLVLAILCQALDELGARSASAPSFTCQLRVVGDRPHRMGVLHEAMSRSITETPCQDRSISRPPPHACFSYAVQHESMNRNLETQKVNTEHRLIDGEQEN